MHCVLFADGSVHVYHRDKRHLLVQLALASDSVLSDSALNKSALISIYNKFNTLLLSFRAESRSEAVEWHGAFAKAIQMLELDLSFSFTKAALGLGRTSKIRTRLPRDSCILCEDLKRRVEHALSLNWTQSCFRYGIRVLECASSNAISASFTLPASVNDAMKLIAQSREEWDQQVDEIKVLEENPGEFQMEHILYKKLLPYLLRPRDAVCKKCWTFNSSGGGLVAWYSVESDRVPVFMGENKNLAVALLAAVLLLGFGFAQYREAIFSVLTICSMYFMTCVGEAYFGVQSQRTRTQIFLTAFLISPAIEEQHGRASCYVTFYDLHNPKGLFDKLAPTFLSKMLMRTQIDSLVSLRALLEREQYDVLTDIEDVADYGRRRRTSTISEFFDDPDMSEWSASEEEVYETKELKSRWGMNPSQWCETPVAEEPFMVRSKNYLQDGVKIPATSTMFKLVALDLFQTDEIIKHVAARPDNVLPVLSKDKFTLVINFIVPGPPKVNMIAYFVCRNPSTMKQGTPFGDCLHAFLHSEDDSFKNERLKIIPRVIDGGYAVKRVG